MRGRWISMAACIALVALCEVSSRAAQTFGLYQSFDGGASWKEAAHPFKSIRVNALHAEGERVWAGTEKGLFASRDSGKTWRDLGQSRLGVVKGIAVARDVMVVGTKTGLWRAQKGSDWTQAAELGGQFVRSVATDGTRFFAGMDRGGVFVSSDQGVTWTAVSEGLPQSAQIFELKANAQGQVFAALYSLGFYTLGEGGWRNVGAPFGFSVLPVDGENMVAGGNPGGVVWSGDGGTSWAQAAGIARKAPTWMLFRNKGTLFVGTSGRSGLFWSDDVGRSWAPIGEKDFGGKAVVTMVAAGDVLVAATVNATVPDGFDFGRIVGIVE